MGHEPTTYCRYCGEAFDVYHAPDERVCDGCSDTRIERAELGVDGDHAFALLGADFQIGEAVFIKVENDDPWHTSDKHRAERCAATKAFRQLQAMFTKPISYFLGSSHPDHC